MAWDRLPQLDDDGLVLPEARDWAETKYRLIGNYAEMFATSMRGKWDTRVYVDLFAGAGRARVRETQAIVPTSAMLALQVRHPFDRYVFCDINSDRLRALKIRADRDSPEREVRLVAGDCNASASLILAEIPRARRVLSFCVVDPYRVADLNFATVAALAERSVDFLVLIPSYMDAHRNLKSYLQPGNRTIGEFIGDPRWRERWMRIAAEPAPKDFGSFVVDRFSEGMRNLGYLYEGPGEEVLVRGKGKRRLYSLAFFSRHPLGRKFWRQARHYSEDQLALFERGSR
jgi:three-Cys-motif partner protein